MSPVESFVKSMGKYHKGYLKLPYAFTTAYTTRGGGVIPEPDSVEVSNDGCTVTVSYSWSTEHLSH